MKSQATQRDKRSPNSLHERSNPKNGENKHPEKKGQSGLYKKENGKEQNNPVIPFHLERKHYESQY